MVLGKLSGQLKFPNVCDWLEPRSDRTNVGIAFWWNPFRSSQSFLVKSRWGWDPILFLSPLKPDVWCLQSKIWARVKSMKNFDVYKMWEKVALEYRVLPDHLSSCGLTSRMNFYLRLIYTSALRRIRNPTGTLLTPYVIIV